MNIGERIENRRKELGMSVDTLAEKVGKSRATIYRYESGYIEKLPTNTLIPFAEALLTSPAYLMGWTDDPTPTHEDEDNDKMKKQLLSFYDNLGMELREKLLERAGELDKMQKYRIYEDRMVKVKEEFKEEYPEEGRHV